MPGGARNQATIDAALWRSGEYWTLVFDGREVRIRDSKGMRHLATLLSAPNRDVAAIELETLVSEGVGSTAATTAASAGLQIAGGAGEPLLDQQAKSAYRARIEDLREELEEAERFNDPERAARAREELDALEHELSSALGLGGRDRRAGTAEERARINASRAIHAVVRKLSEHDAALGRHLDSTVLTGRVCTYRPSRDSPVRWRTSAAPALSPPAAGEHRTRYTRAGEVSIAYQVIGEGPVDLVLFPGWFSHMDLQWASPLMTKFLERMASFSRLIMFDKRGVGLSDPVASAPTLDERMDDLRVVMDAAESEQAVIFGLSEGGTMSALFAAAYPERVRALVLYAAWAAGPLVMAEHRLPGWEKTLKSVSILDDAVEHWGDGGIVSMMAPTIAESPAALEFTGAFERAALSRRMASDLWEAIKHHDARAALPLIQAPTLVLHRRDEVVPVEQSRYMAQHIAGAKLIELDGVDHFPWVGDTEAVTKPVEQFIAQLGPPTPRRESVLATVLLLDAPDLHEQRDLIRRELVRHQGREQRFSRAGLLATFGGPARAVTCAAAIRDRLDAHGVLVRAGLHTGECEIAANGMRGIAVEIGAQVASLAAPGEVLVSRTVRDLLYGADIEFAERGVSTLSGPSTPWELYSIARAG